MMVVLILEVLEENTKTSFESAETLRKTIENIISIDGEGRTTIKLIDEAKLDLSFAINIDFIID